MKSAGVDLGYSRTKFVYGRNEMKSFPSVVGGRFVGYGLTEQEGLIFDQPPCVVGDAAVKFSPFDVRNENRDWFFSDQYLALLLAALSEIFAGSGEVKIVTGLPVEYYISDREAVKTRLAGTHSFQRTGRKAQTISVQPLISAQGFGAAFNLLMDNNGRITNESLALSHIGIIDIGGKTTNIIHAYELSSVEAETKTIPAGGWDVIATLRRLMMQKFRNLDMRDHDLQTALIRGNIVHEGREISIKNEIEESCSSLLAQVLAGCSQAWKSTGSLSLILITGGGAHLIGKQIAARFPQAKIDDDPVYGNAKGFWKFAQRE